MVRAAKHGDGITTTQVEIPATRDPLVNTWLRPLGRDQSGEERFWISSWNRVSGTTGIAVSASGEAAYYRFGARHPGFYSSVPESANTLWLCGNLSAVVRLDLSRGTFEAFDTGAPSALVFQGMVFDPATGKLFAAAYAPPRTVAFSFDTRSGKTSRLYEGPCEEHYMCNGFPNGDRTYSCLVYNPGVTALRWDPVAETVEADSLSAKVPDLAIPVQDRTPFSRLIADESDRRYFPGWGWYDPRLGAFGSGGPRPDSEATWIGRIEREAWGVRAGPPVSVARWDLETGEVTDLATVDDATPDHLALAESGDVVAVSAYGRFTQMDGRTGSARDHRDLDTGAVGQVDCLRRVDAKRLLGTPFISQRFWEADLDHGIGRDRGRAAPGGGQVALTWKLADTVYMACYAGGHLVEYQPGGGGAYPENPRAVVSPERGMRPVAGTDDGRNIYYACNHHYGELGSVLVRYDTRSGEQVESDDVLPGGRAIRGMCYDRSYGLIVGSTVEADCRSAVPVSDHGLLALVDPGELVCIQSRPVPTGARTTTVHGALSEHTYLCTAEFRTSDGSTLRRFDVDAAHLAAPPSDEMEDLPSGTRGIQHAGQEGLFVLRRDDRFELWDMRTRTRADIISTDPAVYSCVVQDGSAYLVDSKEITVLDGYLAASN